MDLKKLTRGEMVVAASGVLLLIFSFFKWYGIEVKLAGTTLASVSENGWGSPDSLFSVLAIVIGVVMAAHVIATKLFGVEVPTPGKIGWGLLHLILGVVALVLLLIKWLGNNDYTKIGLYLGILSAVGLAVGGFLIAKERNELPAQLGGKA